MEESGRTVPHSSPQHHRRQRSICCAFRSQDVDSLDLPQQVSEPEEITTSHSRQRPNCLKRPQNADSATLCTSTKSRRALFPNQKGNSNPSQQTLSAQKSAVQHPSYNLPASLQHHNKAVQPNHLDLILVQTSSSTSRGTDERRWGL